MTFKVSTGLRNKLLDTGSLKAILAGGFIKIYSGTVPADADAALGGATLLATIYSNGTSAGLNFDTAAASGVIAKATGETWSQTSTTASGTATFYRFIAAAGDDGTLSLTQARLQGSVGVAGADMNLTSTTTTATAVFTLTYFAVALPTA